MNLDNYATQIFDDNKNMMVPWYLMASYAYYKEDDPILSDALFDDMGKKLLENWDNITHLHKEYITKDELVAGSFLGKYPSRIPDSLRELRKVDPKTKIKTPKATAKTWICEHLDEAVPNKEFFTDKVFNQQVLERIEKYIQPIFNYNSSSEDGFDIDDVMEQDED